VEAGVEIDHQPREVGRLGEFLPDSAERALVRGGMEIHEGWRQIGRLPLERMGAKRERRTWGLPRKSAWSGRPARYTSTMNRMGVGYDVHRLVEGRKLYLGGVEIAHSRGLEGHSDADVLMHAICDAILGALGENDIGHFFPNTDPRWQGVRSKVFLQEAARQVAFHEGKIVNVDATIIAQEPKLAGHVSAMKENIALALGVNVRRVGIKATTNETLGFIGRGEGIAAMAVASVETER
jgi:2-C-methyl-D-erythritol 2,4-cyclodiphosphate synthase